ncbi:hypothetical protein FHR81_004117 [Actinoalloteichus hoggarensis]|uniref:Uncharacterized protein n=1 Tax=Actinoalloteichus hoggarensis TaxID=1470176 RepID=A0A221WA96_9PSEU|nr:hypothetical protein [Actinoalloteichus hoggarensis]ASO22526.1 hypothetical protein AHOG_24605 [Actinoalloteichus hoggarensis]MBB5923050.1 hypothetical protein [Actinoalloteichus hoggarensis]
MSLLHSRLVGALGLLTVGLFAAGCVTPPEPPMGTGSGAVLDESLVAYDNLDFQTELGPIFDNTCESLPPGVFSDLGLEGEPMTSQGVYAGCSISESWGTVFLSQTRPTGRESQRRYFEDTWRGEGVYSDHFRRWILQDRYYTVTYEAGSVGNECTTAVHTGYEGPFQVTAAIPREESDRLNLLDRDYPVDQLVADYCSRAEEMADILVATLDPDGGSRRTTG